MSNQMDAAAVCVNAFVSIVISVLNGYYSEKFPIYRFFLSFIDLKRSRNRTFYRQNLLCVIPNEPICMI